MSLESVRAFLAANAPDIEILDDGISTATVFEAAAHHKVAPAQIAKTLSLWRGDEPFILVVGGDCRLDNKKAKAVFGGKVKMLSAEEAPIITGHPIGGICPFGLARDLKVYCDVSLRDFDVVLPAAGSPTSAFRIEPERIAALARAVWVDVCQK